MSWRPLRRGSPVATTTEIGATLLPEHRGHGVGTAAHRALVDYLWRHTTTHRLEAWTDRDNVAEQRVLERVGFAREGELRQVEWRDGGWRDAVVYGLLRD